MGDASTSAPATPTSILICREDGNGLFVDDADDGSPAGGAEFSLAGDAEFSLSGDAEFFLAGDDHLLLLDRDDEYVALMLSKEGVGCGGGSAQGEEMEEWLKVARTVCVDWIVKTNAGFLFSWKTAYVAVTYLDRFLAHRRLDRGKEWALQLLSVACLSLAAKVEEHRAPRLPEFRLEEYDFDSASILRMELLVLGTLKWQMITGTPFPYLSCFAARFRHDERKAIILRAVKCIFASIKVMSSVEYQPSTIALASILVAGGNREETLSPNLDELKVILGSSWQHWDTGHVYPCYSVMIQGEDRSMQQWSSRKVASSSVSAAHIGVSSDSSMGTNNVIATTSAAATPDNKRKRLHSPQQLQ